MSQLVVCSVFDSAIQAYGQPIFVPRVGAAIRSFTDEVNRNADDNQFFKHPDDYELHCLSAWDNETGLFFSLTDQSRVLCRGKDVKENV